MGGETQGPGRGACLWRTAARWGAFAAAAPVLGALATAVLSLPALPAPAAAQALDVAGYALGVGTRAGEAPGFPAATGMVGRLRIMPTASLGDVTLEAAYEHVLTRTSTPGGAVRITDPGGAAGSTDWLPLGWTVRENPTTTWRHRFDRLALRLDAGAVEVTVGRQAVSWATTLFLTPADPFSPFDPSDPFREYRGGVDAVRIRTFPGPFSELEAVVRRADTPAGATTTALLRGQTSVAGGVWSVGGWAGAVHDDAAVAAFATGSVGSTAVRIEASVRARPEGDGAVPRASVGVDRYFRPADRDLLVVLEVQHDGLGAADPSGLIPTASSEAYTRGELQTLGRNTLAGQASYQVHPLVSVAALGLVNLDDGSALGSVSLGWSADARTSVSAGAFFGLGDDGFDLQRGLASEYGAVPRILYASVSVFF